MSPGGSTGGSPEGRSEPREEVDRDALPVLPQPRQPGRRLAARPTRARPSAAAAPARVRPPVHHRRGGDARRGQAQRRDRAVQPGQGRRRRAQGLPGPAGRRGPAAAAGPAGRGRHPGHRRGRGARHEVGLAILRPLRELDEVAYLRFASVYRAFDSLEDFENEIAELRARHVPAGTPAAARPASRDPRRSAGAAARPRSVHGLRTVRHRPLHAVRAPTERGASASRDRTRQHDQGELHTMTETDDRLSGTRARRPQGRRARKGLKVERVFTTARRAPLRRGRPGSAATSS